MSSFFSSPAHRSFTRATAAPARTGGAVGAASARRGRSRTASSSRSRSRTPTPRPNSGGVNARARALIVGRAVPGISAALLRRAHMGVRAAPARLFRRTSFRRRFARGPRGEHITNLTIRARRGGGVLRSGTFPGGAFQVNRRF